MTLESMPTQHRYDLLDFVHDLLAFPLFVIVTVFRARYLLILLLASLIGSYETARAILKIIK
jgi:hypothetical protein